MVSKRITSKAQLQSLLDEYEATQKRINLFIYSRSWRDRSIEKRIIDSTARFNSSGTKFIYRREEPVGRWQTLYVDSLINRVYLSRNYWQVYAQRLRWEKGREDATSKRKAVR